MDRSPLLKGYFTWKPWTLLCKSPLSPLSQSAQECLNEYSHTNASLNAHLRTATLKPSISWTRSLCVCAHWRVRGRCWCGRAAARRFQPSALSNTALREHNRCLRNLSFQPKDNKSSKTLRKKESPNPIVRGQNVIIIIKGCFRKLCHFCTRWPEKKDLKWSVTSVWHQKYKINMLMPMLVTIFHNYIYWEDMGERSCTASA